MFSGGFPFIKAVSLAELTNPCGISYLLSISYVPPNIYSSHNGLLTAISICQGNCLRAFALAVSLPGRLFSQTPAWLLLPIFTSFSKFYLVSGSLPNCTIQVCTPTLILAIHRPLLITLTGFSFLLSVGCIIF